MPRTENSRALYSALLLAAIFLVLLVLHFPLLRLPYFWDEAGYFIPAARDLLLTGSLIPHSTVSNAHPPLVMAYLALWWKVFGFAPVITRLAMLLMSSFALLGLFLLAKRIANTEVAFIAIVCTALHPVFFAQSSLAQLDLAAAGLSFWGLKAYVEKRWISTAVWFSLAVVTKETAILAPMGLALWEILKILYKKKFSEVHIAASPKSLLFSLMLPVLPLTLWYAYHYHDTGFIFGNPEFLRYNVQSTMHPLRITFALLMRLWQTFGYMNLFLLTVAGILAMWRPPLRDHGKGRPRITVDVQLAFLAVVVAYILCMALIGGAVLARYMLPAFPLVIVIFVSTLWRRVEMSRWIAAIVVVGLIVALFINPPYTFSPEDNLAYCDYVRLHQDAEHFLETSYPKRHVLTAWPASDELTRPFLGYVSRPIQVVRIEDFRMEQLMSAADVRSGFDVALVFSTKYEPPNPLLRDWPAWERIKMRYFDYHRDLPPAVAARILGGEIVFSEKRKGQWVAVIEKQQIMEASLR